MRFVLVSSFAGIVVYSKEVGKRLREEVGKDGEELLAVGDGLVDFRDVRLC